jgi:hypothetical protein
MGLPREEFRTLFEVLRHVTISECTLGVFSASLAADVTALKTAERM